MPARVAVYVMPGHRRSVLCTQAMKAGIREVGDVPTIINDTEHKGATHDVCVFYGFTPDLQKVMADLARDNVPESPGTTGAIELIRAAFLMDLVRAGVGTRPRVSLSPVPALGTESNHAL